jgi:hypothetical protein
MHAAKCSFASHLKIEDIIFHVALNLIQAHVCAPPFGGAPFGRVLEFVSLSAPDLGVILLSRHFGVTPQVTGAPLELNFSLLSFGESVPAFLFQFLAVGGIMCGPSLKNSVPIRSIVTIFFCRYLFAVFVAVAFRRRPPPKIFLQAGVFILDAGRIDISFGLHK